MNTQRITVTDGVALEAGTWAAAAHQAGPAMLLVHGLASNARLWEATADRLAELGHPVATVDLRGHGQSDKPDDGYDMATIAGDVAAVLQALRGADAVAWDRPVVVGQSWGGNVVLELAFRYPEALRGIVCVDGGMIDLAGRFDSWPECALMLAPPRLKGTPVSQLEAYLRTAHPSWPESGIQGTLANFEIRPDGTVAPWLTFKRHIMVLQGLWGHRPGTRYPAIPVPVLLVPADDGHAPSTAAKKAEVDAAMAALPNGSVHWFEGDHDLHAQHPDELAAKLHEAALGVFA